MDLGRIQSDLGRTQLGLEVLKNFNGGVKKSIGALDIFNGGVKKSNGGIEKGQWGHCKNPAGVLCRVNGGIGGSMVALKRGVGQGQCGY